MAGQVILYVVLALPLVLGLAFRVAASHLFFALMAGELLGRYFGHDIDKLVGGTYGELLLVVAPMAATAFILRNGISKRRLLIQAVPLAAMGVICAAFLLPLLPDALQDQVGAVTLGRMLIDLNRAIVGGMVVVQLAALWYMHRKAAV